jgi:hypothetical protein
MLILAAVYYLDSVVVCSLSNEVKVTSLLRFCKRAVCLLSRPLPRPPTLSYLALSLTFTRAVQSLTSALQVEPSTPHELCGISRLPAATRTAYNSELDRSSQLLSLDLCDF